MTAMPEERRERLLITTIGLSILIVVLAVGYLAYQTLPQANGTDDRSLPATASAPQTVGDERSSETSPGGSRVAAPAGQDGTAQGTEPDTTVDRSTAQDPGSDPSRKEG